VFVQATAVGVLEVGPGAQVRLAGGSVMASAAFGLTPFAISGSGTLRIDPGVAVTGPVTGVTVLPVPLPVVTANGGPIGTTATATMRGPAGHLGVLLLGVASAPVTLPGLVDDVWLAPGAVSMAAGVFGAPLAAGVAVPGNPLLLGSRFGWQGVTLDPSGALALTNPSLFAP
jgi:hypothetical protein